MRNRKILLLTVKIIMILLLAVIVAACVFVGVQIRKAPALNSINISPAGYLTVINDKDGERIDSLSKAESNRVYVPLDDISPYCQQAFVAIEDSRFYHHHGIDVHGIARAFVIGIKEQNFSQGASTITQQLIKNNVLTTWMDEETLYDSICRKVQEQYLAVLIEQRYSKDWILENYLNTINLGCGTRGVQVASQYYFGIDASDLTLGKAALLAGITQNPSRYDPMNNPEESLNRQHMVLEAMRREEMISEQDYQYAMNEDVIGELRDLQDSSEQVFSWFEDAMLESVVTDLMTTYHYTEEQAWDLLYAGGLTIETTQDSRLQKICETAVADPAISGSDAEVSVVMLNDQDGSVAALIGGKEKDSSLIYNRATESIRQPGSTIKTIGEYAAALDLHKVTLGTTMDDAPYAYSNGSEIHNSYGDYRGMTTVRQAIASSGNIIALKTYQLAGEHTVMDYLTAFGITTLSEEDRTEALSIGGTYHGVTNLELTGAYRTIENKGIYIEPYYYTEVLDHDGNVLLSHQVSSYTVISPETSFLLTSAMTDVMTSGTGTKASFDGMPLAGKTGTTNNNVDTWMVGYSPYYTCGVWTGYDDSSPQNDSSYVKALWKSIMQQSHESLDYKEFPSCDSMECVQICTKCGNLETEGLCCNAYGGDATATEYFADGTQPTTYCDCHVKVKICQESGMKADKYCPKQQVKEYVYLKTATEGTADASYTVPEGIDEPCTTHTHAWDGWTHKQNEEPGFGWSDIFSWF